MASISPSTWVSPASTSITASSSSPTSSKPALISPLKLAKRRRFCTLKVRTSPSDSPERTPDETPETPDMVTLAFAKAKAYQKAKLSRPATEENPAGENVVSTEGGNSSAEVPDSVKLAMGRARDYKKNKGGVGIVTGGFFEGSSGSGPAVPDSRATEYKDNRGAVAEPIDVPEGSSGLDPVGPESMRLAVERATENRDGGVVDEPGGVSEGRNELGRAVPDSVKLAMETAREYKKNKIAAGGDGTVAEKLSKNSGLEKMKVGNPESILFDNKNEKPGELKVSNIDFLGLDFSEKKNRRVPAGLVPVADPFSDGDLPEVEILVGHASRFESLTSSKPILNEADENAGLYKPKVSTWGVFPRPSNISKTFGGGRNIRPGEVLENAEVKAAKEEHTRQLISSYKSKIGLTIDAKMKAECEKALKEGDHLMDMGKLREALPYYEKIMNSLAFQSELHGIAALQWSICQDSLSRSNEVRVMYERLRSHPSVKVSKKARQLMFGFEAMEMMKVAGSSISKTTGYESYFDAIVEDNVNYAPETVKQDENALGQALPYLLFLVSPVFVVMMIAMRKTRGF